MHLAWFDLFQGLNDYDNAEADTWHSKGVMDSSDFTTCIWRGLTDLIQGLDDYDDIWYCKGVIRSADFCNMRQFRFL